MDVYVSSGLREAVFIALPLPDFFTIKLGRDRCLAVQGGVLMVGLPKLALGG